MNVRGIYVPDIMYGTAWKEDSTESLVLGALRAGFRAIDTANQRKHYYEQGVGRGIARAEVPRDHLFLQSKFTFLDGQDDRLPFDPRASIGHQVMQSFDSSLEHLGTDHLDSLVLHGPSRRHGLGPEDREAWRAMTVLAAGRRVALLGVSNVTAAQLADFVELAASTGVPVAFVQNRCYASRGWDRDVRAVCAEHDIVYQAFSLLTANRDAVVDPRLRAIAARHGATAEQVIFRFAQQSGMLPLTGTSSPVHMKQDLELAFELAAAELATIAAL